MTDPTYTPVALDVKITVSDAQTAADAMRRLTMSIERAIGSFAWVRGTSPPWTPWARRCSRALARSRHNQATARTRRHGRPRGR